jgi:hypothetical protein
MATSFKKIDEGEERTEEWIGSKQHGRKRAE